MLKRSDVIEQIRHIVPKDSAIVDDLIFSLGDLDREDVLAYYIQPETYFDKESVYNIYHVYLIVDNEFLAVTSEFIDHMHPQGEIMTTLMNVPLKYIRDYRIVRRRIAQGEEEGAFTGVYVQLSWEKNMLIDLIPTECNNEDCEKDHGYTGRLYRDYFEIALDSSMADEDFQSGINFAHQLNTAIRNARHG
ncbi:MAG: hypothetical protein J6M18_06205 [Actinomycetaceae bacterium]|nr:hypothetical protein [Actinomycetaceae bacterium]